MARCKNIAIYDYRPPINSGSSRKWFENQIRILLPDPGEQQPKTSWAARRRKSMSNRCMCTHKPQSKVNLTKTRVTRSRNPTTFATLPASTRRRFDAPTCRRVDASTCRRVVASSRQRIDVSTRRCVDATTRQHVDASTRRRVDTFRPRRKLSTQTSY